MDISCCVEWFNALPTTSPAMKVMGQLMATRAFDPLFPIDLCTQTGERENPAPDIFISGSGEDS